MIKRLHNNNLLYKYEKIFNGWLKENIIEIVPKEEISNPSFYLPHSPVIKEDSTTRIRPIFDASVKSKNQPSLNQCLEAGPNLIELIPSILLRFRENKIDITADIQKAFLQISIASEERDVTRSLWRHTQKPEELIIYRHCRIVFGITSSPFLLGATMNLHLERTLEETQDIYSKGIVQKLKQSFCVDNCITSAKSIEEAIIFKENAISILAESNFDLRGWQLSDMSSSSKFPVLRLI
ncbi:PREDICTED: uncharacterized protein LOC108776351 [Cyphomyrmex costatus]|uniref:uncharacterized protein LOC108776351 n=1 Tax=Cyphomyrmex costatus TaxID=456900 RepID=UPI000852459B|nr:PREDICTED: uncharacterized protein LOC108776351 [Cyphomyrmex costatus]